MKRWLLIIVPVVVLGGLIAARVRVKKADAADQDAIREMRMKAPPVVSVTPVVYRDIVEKYESIATAESPYNVKISPKVTGRIDFLQVREGDRVNTGDVLVRLDPTEVEGQVQQARAAVAEAQSRLAQAALTLGPTETNISTNIRQQQAGVEVAKSDLNLVLTNSEFKKANQRTFITDAAGRVRNAEAAIARDEAAVKAAKANLENAKAKMNRVSDLYKQGFIAAQDVDDARTQVSAMEGALDVAQGDLNSGKANRDSMLAQKEAAEKQYSIGVNGVMADTASAKSRLRQAEAVLEYAKSNTAQKPAYEKNISALKSAVAAAEANLRSVESRRADTVLRAPISGIVASRSADPGATATPGLPVLTLVGTNQLWVSFGAPEEVNRKVTSGMPVTVVFDGLPDRQFTARVIHQNPSADPANRQFQVRAAVDKPGDVLKPGMFGRVKLVTSQTLHAMAVPREAVQEGRGDSSVVVIDDNKVAHRRSVTAGPADTNFVSIVSGVQPGENVVILSAGPVKDGVTVHLGGDKAAGRPPSPR